MTLKNARIITAMVTPFHPDGSLAVSLLPEVIEYLLSHGTEGLVVAGTTGEAPTLSKDEKILLFKETIRLVNHRVPVICGIGSNSTQETMGLVKEVAQLEGVTAGLCVVPYYNKPNQEGIYQHMKAVANASDLPLILYNVPGRTGVSMSLETTVALSQLPTIIGTKECDGLDVMSQIIEQTEDDFLVYTGEDSLALPTLAIGGQGVISVSSHVVGDNMQAMYRAFQSGETSEAAKIHRQLIPSYNAVFSFPSPAPIKAIYNEWGLTVGDPRLPMTACTKQETIELMKDIKK